MRPSLEEQETHISYGKMDGVAKIYTSDLSEMIRFDNLVKKNPDQWKFIEQTMHEGDIVGKFYECPKEFVSYRSKKKAARELTEEQREALRERLRAIRNR
jgi:hypothetical protein